MLTEERIRELEQAAVGDGDAVVPRDDLRKLLSMSRTFRRLRELRNAGATWGRIAQALGR